MKKGKIILGALTLFIATGAAFAFKANTKLPGDLYYFDSLHQCVQAPCEKTNNTGNVCKNAPLYTNVGCTIKYSVQAFTTDGGANK